MSKVTGFSKLTKQQKINWLIEHYFKKDVSAAEILSKYWNSDLELQKLHDGFIENAISNFYLPYAVSPNFLIDEEYYTIPMVTEESSVIAASSKAAKFWSERGGFQTQILGTIKTGHIHFIYQGNPMKIEEFFYTHKKYFLNAIEPLQENMKKRGGGILSVDIKNQTHKLADYYQIEFKFDTVDSMGANFINTILEEFSEVFMDKMPDFLRKKTEIIMSILSNLNPECLVRASVECPVEDLETSMINAENYVNKFLMAIKIAEVEPYRAATHNKGIMNGVDAVVIATGNDFRAVEAGVHAYASMSGQYRSLSHAEVQDGKFKFWMDIPLAVGTVGGLTALHPLVKFSLQLLKHPSAKKLMKIIAAAGLAQNFAAVNALITEGIQQGHMKMHLNNLLKLLHANSSEIERAKLHFQNKKVTFSELKKLLHRK